LKVEKGLTPPPKQQEISQRVEAAKEQTGEKPTIIEVSALRMVTELMLFCVKAGSFRKIY
jgi:hypothetical protein